MKCTDFSMNLVLENVMKIENFQIFIACKASMMFTLHFGIVIGNEFFAHFHRTVYMKAELGKCI